MAARLAKTLQISTICEYYCRYIIRDTNRKFTTPETIVTFTADLTDEQAWQVAQFAKRSTFDIFYRLTEAHLPKEESKRLVPDGEWP